MTLPEAMRYRCWDCGAKDTKLCAMCDAWYCDAHKKPHDHPEPQSGPARDAWIAAGLPYDAWVRVTEAGRVWVGRRKPEDIVVTAWTCATCRGHSTIVCDPDVGAIPCPACALAVHGPKDVVVTARPVELVAKALEPTVWDRIGTLVQKLAGMQGGPKQLTGKHVVKISYYEHDGSAMVEVEDRGREVAHSDEHFRKETPDALLDALKVVCKEVGACT